MEALRAAQYTPKEPCGASGEGVLIALRAAWYTQKKNGAEGAEKVSCKP